MEKVPMTADGYAAVEAELKHLKTVERPRIIAAIAEARSHGDLSENAEYHAAKEQQGLTEARVADLEDKLNRADVIDVSKLSGNAIKFRAIAPLIDEDTSSPERDTAGHRGKGAVPDRRRSRGGREGAQDFHHLADRPCADREIEGRHRRGFHARRREVLRNHVGQVLLNRMLSPYREQLIR